MKKQTKNWIIVIIVVIIITQTTTLKKEVQYNTAFMKVGYTDALSTMAFYDDERWIGQTFIAPETFTLKSIRLKGTLNPGTFTVSLRNTPTGPDLVTSMCDFAGDPIVDLPFPDYEIYAGQEYVIVARSDEGFAPKFDNYAGYNDGQLIHSEDYGVTWEYIDYDLWFEVWGVSDGDCFEDWECTGWSTCQDEIQTRTCTDVNGCGTEDYKPSETQQCGVSGVSYDTFTNYVSGYIEGSTFNNFIQNSNTYLSGTQNTYYDNGFSYTHTYPVYGLDDIRTFYDFDNKCFVGKCNPGHVRHVVCINPDYTADVETFNCGVPDNIIQPSFGGVYPYQVNVYYFWNDYVGYDSTWQSRWESQFVLLLYHLNELGVTASVTYYEYQLPGDDMLPAYYFTAAGITPDHPAYVEGDIQVTVFADNGRPAHCNSAPNWACFARSVGSSAILPDHKISALMHEFGHAMGCGHPGVTRSLAPTIWYGGAMSWNAQENKYWYECRIKVWMLGKNG